MYMHTGLHTKICTNFHQVKEAFEDFDHLRSGSISKTRFRRCLATLGLSKLRHHDLNDSQFALLCRMYQNPMKEDQVLWAKFAADVESGECFCCLSVIIIVVIIVVIIIIKHQQQPTLMITTHIMHKYAKICAWKMKTFLMCTQAYPFYNKMTAVTWEKDKGFQKGFERRKSGFLVNI